MIDMSMKTKTHLSLDFYKQNYTALNSKFNSKKDLLLK